MCLDLKHWQTSQYRINVYDKLGFISADRIKRLKDLDDIKITRKDLNLRHRDCCPLLYPTLARRQLTDIYTELLVISISSIVESFERGSLFK